MLNFSFCDKFIYREPKLEETMETMGEEIARQILFQPPSKTMSGSLNGQERKKAHTSSQAQNQNSDSASKDSASASVHSRLSDMSHFSNENAIDPEQTAFATSATSATLHANFLSILVS
jgi:hypothetical protein